MAWNLPRLSPAPNRPGSARVLGFWEFVALARSVRIAIAIIVPLAIVVDGSLRFADELSGGTLEFAFSTLTSCCFLLFLWRPPIAAIGLITAGSLAVAIDQSGGYLTALTASVGLVVATCSTPLSTVFSGLVVGWIIVVAAIPPGLPAGGVLTLFVIAILSAAIGHSITAMVRRNQALRQALDTHDERLEIELSAERARIADELHDIIAHDIAIVAMHARVLDLATDQETRSVSQKAISKAAAQALADTRRVLHLIHGRQEDPSALVAGTPGIRDAIPPFAEQLRVLGDTVQVSIEEGPELAKSIDAALVRMAREAVTNIVKHGDAPRTVSFVLTFSREVVELRVQNGPQNPDAAPHPISGYGLARLHERAELLGGSFSAGMVGDSWVARMTLPHR